MALSFPLGLADFIDAIPVHQITWKLADPVTLSRTGGGDVIRHRRGARLWGGEIVIDMDHHAVHAATEALMARLEDTDASFLLYDKRKPAPLADPAGVVAASNVTISAVSGDRRAIALTGLPVGYRISRGDMLSYTYGSSPLRYGLHRAVTTANADATGKIGSLEVMPPIRSGSGTGAAVTLVKPRLKARLIEADYGEGRAAITPGGSLRWVQTLR